MRTKKFLFFLLVAVILGACGKKEKAEKKPPGIVLWLPFGDKRSQDVIVESVNEFKEKTGYSVTIARVPWGEIRTKLHLVAGTKHSPNVVFMGTDMPIIFAAMGHLRDLREFIEKDNFPLQDYYKAGWQCGSIGDSIYSAPYFIEVRCLYYRKDLFVEKGVEEPSSDWTWEDLLDAAKRLTDKEKGIYGFPIVGDPQDGIFMYWVPILYTYGGDFYDKDYNHSVLKETSAVESMRLYARFVWEDAAPKESIRYNITDVRNLFKAGKSAMIIDAPFFMQDLRRSAPELDGKWEVAPPPGAIVNGEFNRAVFCGGVSLCIFKAAEEKDRIAWELIKFFLSKEQQIKWYKMEIHLPSNLKSIEDVEWTYPEDSQRVRTLFKSVIKDGIPEFKVVFDRFVGYEPLSNTLQNIILNNLDVQKAMDELAKQYNDLLATAIYVPGRNREVKK